MIPLRQALQDYLCIRRQLGFKLRTDGQLLESFVGFLERAGAERITIELALMWARQPVQAHPNRWRQRLGIVRGFARYLATIDPDSEVPSVERLLAPDRWPERVHRPLPPLPGMLSEPPGADPHAGWCGRGQGKPGLYPIRERGRRKRTARHLADAPISPPSGCCCASPCSRPASSPVNWTSPISTRR
jgi:hypothetical protein